MKKLLLAILVLTFAAGIANAQNQHFTTNGVIEYTRRINMYAIIQKMLEEDDTWGEQFFENYKKRNPQFRELKSTLTFGDNKSLFVPIEEENSTGDWWSNSPSTSQINTVYTDMSQSKNVIQKHVFEQTYLMTDSIRKIHWKITDETREIAGYTCRRANAIVMDSIYVVAFYTDKIHVSGGPENFGGLPGMILELALPHDNTVWIATKITDVTVDEKSIAPPKKGKPVNQAELKATLKSAMQGWGKEANMNIKALML
jgi:GLPGLI family protein